MGEGETCGSSGGLRLAFKIGRARAQGLQTGGPRVPSPAPSPRLLFPTRLSDVPFWGPVQTLLFGTPPETGKALGLRGTGVAGPGSWH